MENDNLAKYVHCPTCRSIHYKGEPCVYCYHKAKDEKDIEEHHKIFGDPDIKKPQPG